MIGELWGAGAAYDYNSVEVVDLGIFNGKIGGDGSAEFAGGRISSNASDRTFDVGVFEDLFGFEKFFVPKILLSNDKEDFGHEFLLRIIDAKRQF